MEKGECKDVCKACVEDKCGLFTFLLFVSNQRASQFSRCTLVPHFLGNCKRRNLYTLKLFAYFEAKVF